MKITPFGVEIWMNRYETQCAYNLAETCVDSLTLQELLAIAGKSDDILEELLPLRLGYGAIEGSDRLRTAIAALYDRQSPHNIVVTHGAIGANALVHSTLVEHGDPVIAVVPTYQQHYSIPESLGADVKRLQLREGNGFLPDLDELRRLAANKTKLIALSNPNNPTGALMAREMLDEIVGIAENCGAWLLCDEVYRGIDQNGSGFTQSVADLYQKGVSTGSMSKSFSLAGLRLGWIAAPETLIRDVSVQRDYNTISVGVLDAHLAAIALENCDKILARSQHIVRENLALLDDWVNREPRITYVRPQSGTTALLKYDYDMSSEEFCLRLLARTGVMLTPGSAFDMEGYARIGYANRHDILRDGLLRISEFLRELNG